MSRGRPKKLFSQTQLDELWQRLLDGDTIATIAASLGTYHTAVSNVVTDAGGFAPATRKRSEHHLNLSEREEISRGLSIGESMRSIATRLGRFASTISREIGRNGGKKAYRANAAEDQAWERAKRPKPCKLKQLPKLAEKVAEHLRDDQSPKQISERLKKLNPDDEDMQVSHETIYKTLFMQSRTALNKVLTKHLRTGITRRHPRNALGKTETRGQIPNATCISQRPAEADDRKTLGHWEGDLIEGCKGTYIATLVERKSRLVHLVKVDNKQTNTVVAALIATCNQFPKTQFKSLTWDRGTELASHETFTEATKIPVFFCHPYSPWERGSNENTNKLLRQYLPKGSDLSQHSQTGLNLIADKLNRRFKEVLDYCSPNEVFRQCVATTS